jgi:hypothetical protein
MNKRITLVCFSVFMVFILSNCAPSKLSVDDAQGLLEKISASPFGVTLKADSANIGIEPDKEKSGRFIVTYKNPDFSFNTAMYKHMDLSIPEFDLPITIEELVFAYSPSDNSCYALSVKGMEYSLDPAKFAPSQMAGESNLATKKMPQMYLDYHFGSLVFSNYNISPLLDAKDKSFIEILTGLMEVNTDFKTSLKDMKMGFDLTLKEKVAMTFAIEEAESRMSFAPEFILSFFNQEKETSPFPKLLEEGNPFMKVESTLKNMTMSFQGPKNNINGRVDNMGITYTVEPTAEKDAIDFGVDWNLEGLQVTGFEKKAIEALASLNKLDFHFSLGHLSPEFIDAYFDLIKTAQAMGTSPDPAKQQELAMKGPALAGIFMNSKPIISISISPLDHKLVKITAEGKFQFITMGPPIGKATVNISNIEELAKKLKAEEIFPAKEIDGFLQKLKELFVLDENGEGTLTFELKEGEQSHFYLNGKQKKF